MICLAKAARVQRESLAAQSAEVGALAPVIPLANDAPVTAQLLESINPTDNDTNCTACVVALEKALAGGPVVPAALSGPTMGENILNLAGAEDFTDVPSEEALDSAFAAMGNGTRGAAVYELPNGKLQAINVINSGGKVWFIDAQAAGQAVLTGCSRFC